MSLENLLNSTFTPYKIHRSSLGKIQTVQVIEIMKGLGFEHLEYNHEIDNYGIKHAKDRHNKDLFALEDKDFYLIEQIIHKPDIVSYEGLSNIKTHVIKYQKKINGLIYCYLEEIRTGRKTLSLKTFYKKEPL